MKMPHGLLYAILIIVGILAVTLYTRQQTSSIGAGAAINAETRKPATDDASATAKSDEDSRAEGAKNAEDAPK